MTDEPAGVAPGQPTAATGADEGEPGLRRRSPLVEYSILVALALVFALLMKAFIAQAFVIPSPSMYPELKKGDRVVVSKLSYHLHSPRRGDVIVFPTPGAVGQRPSSTPVRLVRDVLEAVGLAKPPDDELIKRIVGLPGETVEGHDGHVYINGHLLIEPYLKPSVFTDDFGPVTVPAHDVWVMGDNRTNSADSRVIGPIEEKTIVGRALFRIWPPWRVAFM